LQPLLETQNQLFRRIARTLERERRLTDDAAHELRSPLTAIKTHLQVARMTDGAVREQALEHAGLARLADASSINAVTKPCISSAAFHGQYCV